VRGRAHRWIFSLCCKTRIQRWVPGIDSHDRNPPSPPAPALGRGEPSFPLSLSRFQTSRWVRRVKVISSLQVGMLTCQTLQLLLGPCCLIVQGPRRSRCGDRDSLCKSPRIEGIGRRNRIYNDS